MGALGGTRTPNLLIRSQMLYPLSYERSHCSILHGGRYWCLLAAPHAPFLYAAGMAVDMPCGICGPLRFGLVGDA